MISPPPPTPLNNVVLKAAHFTTLCGGEGALTRKFSIFSSVPIYFVRDCLCVLLKKILAYPHIEITFGQCYLFPCIKKEINK